MADRDPHDERRPASADDPFQPATNGGPDDGDYRLDRLAPDPREQGAPSGQARLGGVDGIGTLQVVRDREGVVLHVEGTWRALDEGTDAGPIDAAVQAGRPLLYEGKLADPAHPERERCEIEVEITSRSTYTWDARKEDDGATLPLYNFRPREGETIDR